MELLHCRHCDSNLVNLIGVNAKHDEYAERNINIKKGYITIKDTIAVKLYVRCYKCTKISEVVVKNQRGCTSIETARHNDKEPRNEIIGVEQGGRFN